MRVIEERGKNFKEVIKLILGEWHGSPFGAPQRAEANFEQAAAEAEIVTSPLPIACGQLKGAPG